MTPIPHFLHLSPSLFRHFLEICQTLTELSEPEKPELTAIAVSCCSSRRRPKQVKEALNLDREKGSDAAAGPPEVGGETRREGNYNFPRRGFNRVGPRYNECND